MLSVAELIEQALDREQDELRIGIEVLVDRRADDQDHVLGFADGTGIGRRVELVGADQALEQLVGAVLPEGHLARADPVDGLGVTVVERDRQARVGEHQPERKPHPATAPDNRNIPRKRHVHPAPPAVTLREDWDDTSGFRPRERAECPLSAGGAAGQAGLARIRNCFPCSRHRIGNRR